MCCIIVLPTCHTAWFARRAEGCSAGRVGDTEEHHVKKTVRVDIDKKERTPVKKAETV